jgi:streptogramin lyase
MRKILVIPVLLSFLSLNGQTPVGSWSDHLSYTKAKSIAVGSAEVFVSTGSSLIIFNKEFAELKKMSRINGLTETGITSLSWSEINKAVIIGYASTNVDLLLNNIIYNIPDIYNKYIPGRKEINRIRTNGKYAYLACSFGIVVIDLIKKEVYDTWKPGTGSENTEVHDITFGNDNIFAATAQGIFSASLSGPGLSYFGNWRAENTLPDPNGNYTALTYTGNRLFVNKSDPLSDGDSIFVLNGTAALFSFQPGVTNLSLDPAPGGFTVSSVSSATYYNNDGSVNAAINSYGFAQPDIAQAVAEDGVIWIADNTSGLIKADHFSEFSVLNLPGPVSDNAFHIASYNGKTAITGGGTDDTGDNLGRPLQVSLFEENNWSHLAQATIKDALRTVIDPADPGHLYISTWGDGLLEYKDNTLIKQYTEANSPLQSIIPGKPYVRIYGISFDSDKKLWITQSGVPGSIKVLKPDGSWIQNPLTIEVPVIGDIIITKTGYKWIILPGGQGLFILDDNKTPDAFDDDRYKRMVVKDTENQGISTVNSLAEDLDGTIWIGTEQGPLIYYNPGRVFDEDLKASRIIIPRNDGSGLSDYMLKTEMITSIAVDGANRKWLGTAGSGAYHLSPDGTALIKNFNIKNSPILSDSIGTLAIDNKSGDVWFGTSKGLQSFRGDATTGGEKFTRVYAFPNPVREDYTGNLTITGLMRDTQINITDISGNLVYKTISEGGQASWDLKTYNGRHVSTGVYLIFCASKDGTQSFVTKILVIR